MAPIVLGNMYQTTGRPMQRPKLKQRRRWWQKVIAVLAWPWVATDRLQKAIYRAKYRR